MYNYYNLLTDIKPDEILMYLRKSRADDPLKSVEEIVANHEKSIDEWCEKNLSGLIPPENRYKEIISGGDSIAERPMFQRVLQLIESTKYKAVIVKEVSRLGRPDTMEIGRISKTFRFTETFVIAIEPMRIFNLADKFERDMFEEELKRSAYYLEYSKQIMRAGIEISVKSGNFVGSIPPYGYERTTVVIDKNKCPTLKIKEDEADVVRMIFNAYVNENIGTQTIAKRLNALNLKTRKNRNWTPDSIRTVIENIHYIGKIRWNRRKGKIVVENGEFRKIRPKNSDDCVVVEGKHEAIISDELFYAAQEKRRRTHRTVDNKELKNPFASMLFCSCGKSMSYRVKKDKFGENAHEPYYICNSQGFCGSGSCHTTEIEDFVSNLLRKKIKEFKIESENKNDELISIHERQIAKLEKTLSDLDAREESMWKSQVDPDVDNRMPSNIFKKLMNDLQAERDRTKQALENAYITRPTPIDYQKKIITFQNALDALLDNNISASEKNFLLKKCIERIDYQRDKPEKVTGKGNGRGWIKAPIQLNVKLIV
jgi:DNA invertase Pin-like site-specific DNA recombinase